VDCLLQWPKPRHLRGSGVAHPKDTVVEIVGIARNGKYQETIDTPAPYVYPPFPQ